MVQRYNIMFKNNIVTSLVNPSHNTHTHTLAHYAVVNLGKGVRGKNTTSSKQHVYK